jgi:hypothetical protein
MNAEKLPAAFAPKADHLLSAARPPRLNVPEIPAKPMRKEMEEFFHATIIPGFFSLVETCARSSFCVPAQDRSGIQA